MTHSMTLVEGTQPQVASQLRSRPAEPYGIHTCPRWLNKELKFLLSALQQDLLRDILWQIQKTFHDMSSRSSIGFWPMLFTSLLVLTIIVEDVQVAVRCKEDTDISEGIIYPSRNSATSTLETIDERLDFLIRMFRQRYHMHGERKNEFNPIKFLSHRENLDDSPSKTLAFHVKRLIDQYSK